MDQDIEQVDIEEAKAVYAMSQTNGWEIIKARLLSEINEHIELLLSIPVIPENLAKVAQVQAQCNGAKYILDMVKDYTTNEDEI